MIKSSTLALLSIILFSGCISVTNELPSYNTYNLNIYEQNIKSTKYLEKSINVLEPKTITSYNSKNILYSKDNLEYDKYALNKWMDRPTKMLQKQMAKYLTFTKDYKYISTSNLKIESDYNLVSQLVDFNHLFEEDKSYAKFTIRVYLVNNKNEKVYFKNFTYKKICMTNDALGFVKTIEMLTNKFYVDLNNFIISSIQ
ncbi:hypothetical protein [Halarcobacter sp.]|uniref:ABC-type transport auxiliary lipoprotein family protein n=1 Tax=Halarcobacter sp. TaxID=2321133 RepID=UPI0029F48749|nr:hypothetical protein [Halarcobacter sp.]